MLLGSLLAKKIKSKSPILTFSPILKHRAFLDHSEPSLLSLFGNVLLLRWTSLSRIEGFIISEAEKVFNELVPREEFLQEARIVAMSIIDSLKFPKMEIISRTLKSRLKKKREKEEDREDDHIDVHKYLPEEEIGEDEALSVFLFRSNSLPQTQRVNLDEIFREAGLFEAEEVLEGRKQLTAPIASGAKFLLFFHGVEEVCS